MPVDSYHRHKCYKLRSVTTNRSYVIKMNDFNVVPPYKQYCLEKFEVVKPVKVIVSNGHLQLIIGVRDRLNCICKQFVYL